MTPENGFQFVRLVGNERREGTTLASVSRTWQGSAERFVFVSPHDDDACLGGGLLIQLAQREKVPVSIMIVTDGRMGYCSAAEEKQITDIRRREAIESYRTLGVAEEDIFCLDFPDCQLAAFRGRWRARPDEPGQIQGHGGLQNAFTYYLRKIRPTQCFLPTASDLHPDHRIVHEEFLISLFHCSGDIWPELGNPVAKVPYVHELGVYCDFPAPPRLRVRAPMAYLERKLQAIAAFKSQRQISALIDIVRKGGPEEYVRAIDFALYQPSKYHDLFEEKPPIPFAR